MPTETQTLAMQWDAMGNQFVMAIPRATWEV